MIDQLAAVIVDEGKWLPASMTFAVLAVLIQLYRQRNSDISNRHRIMIAMNLFFAVTIGMMAFGHLLAVTTKLLLGSLEGSVLRFYLIGIALALPSWWLIVNTTRLIDSESDSRRTTVVLNSWLAVTLLALGIHNLPLAAPAFFNIAYHFHSRRVVGWTILSVAILFNVVLFIGSLIFLASGQSFEEFSRDW